MTEIELKFQVPQQHRDAVAKAVGTATAVRVRLQAQYFDSDDRRLAQARIALRVRKQGRLWVQTLKGAGDGLWQRVEHELPVVVARGQQPVADPALHDGTAAGEALHRALGDASLVPTYASNVGRLQRLMRASGCVVELAFDQGELLAQDRRWPLCELEFELKGGRATAMAGVAARWVQRFGLTLDVRSKSERGDRLARGVTLGAPVKAQALNLSRDVEAQAAVRAIINHCMAQVLGNASEIAHGDSAPDHLHQLRVGLRRLRTALGDLGDLLPAVNPAWQPALRQIFGGLGAARDIDALALTLLPALHKAGAGELQLPGNDAAAPPRSVLVASATNVLWLELLACAADEQAPVTDVHPEQPFAEPLRARLAHLHKQIKGDARRFGSIDDEKRHRLRKRIKRVRYLCDFSAGLYGKKSRQKFLKPLAAAQEALGQFNDVCVAQALFKRTAAHDAQAMFALGWLAHEREAAIERCVGALNSLRKAPVFW
ncbi:MAG: CHAD domain-containing protein [Rubrivivax sp.]